MSHSLNTGDYTVAWIAPLLVEAKAALGVLDKRHDGSFEVRPHDDYVYLAGEINKHNIVIATLPAGQNYGVGAAAALASEVKSRFANLHFALLVGVAAGLPNWSTKDSSRRRDIRLGDVLVCVPDDECTGVVQYDLGRDMVTGFFINGRQAEIPTIVRSAIRNIQLTKENTYRHGEPFSQHLQALQASDNGRQFAYPVHSQDLLHDTTTDASGSPELIARSERERDERTLVWYGRIGSGNALMRNPHRRDELRDKYNLIGLEMEAAGVMNILPTGVIRGVCDYGNSFKNKEWQPYAAAVAAVYAKGLLESIQPPPNLRDDIAEQIKPLVRLPSFQVGSHLDGAPVIDPALFIGRQDELQSMEAALESGITSREQRCVVLGGPGGIGKTQLVLAYIRQHTSSYQSIFWYDATSPTTMKKSLRLMADYLVELEAVESLDDDQIMRWTRRWLSNPQNTQWLLVFDNYDEPNDFDIEEYYPHTSHGAIVVTTRLPDLVNGHRILVPPLNKVEDSLQILQTRSLRPNLSSDSHALQLAERLSGYPLALATAGAYLRKSTLTFLQYLEEYKRKWNFDPRRSAKLAEYRNRTLYTTWDITFSRLEGEDVDAARLLKLLAYFDNENISYDHLKTGRSKNTPQWLLDALEDESSFQSIMGVLVDYCLVEVRATSKSYKIHLCVHDWILAGLEKVQDPVSYWYASNCIRFALPRTPLLFDLRRTRYTRLVPHAVRLAQSAFNDAEALSISTEGHLRAARAIARVLCSGSHSRDAVVVSERVRSGAEKMFGREHNLTLSMSEILAIAHGRANNHKAAQEILFDLVTTTVSAHGNDDPGVIYAFNNFGMVCLDQRKFDDAERVLLEAAERVRRLIIRSGLIQSQLLLCDLAFLYQKLGRVEQALRDFEYAFWVTKDSSHPVSRRRFAIAERLAGIYSGRCQFEKAKEMLLLACKDMEKKFGSLHVSMTDPLRKLAKNAARLRQYHEAEMYIQQAYEIFRAASRPSSASAIATVVEMGDIRYSQGNWDRAEQSYTTALGDSRHRLGSRSTHTLEVLRKLGSLCYVKKQHDRSLEYLREAIDLYEQKRIIGQPLSPGRSNYIESLVCSIRSAGAGSSTSLSMLTRLISIVYSVGVSRYWDVGKLAFGLFCFGDQELATLAWRQAFRLASKLHEKLHIGIYCDYCGQYLTQQIGYNLCQSFYEAEVCDSCLGKYYTGDVKLTKCVNHRFWKVNLEGLENEDERSLNSPPIDQTWFNSICKKYDVQLDENSTAFKNTLSETAIAPRIFGNLSQDLEHEIDYSQPLVSRLWGILDLADDDENAVQGESVDGGRDQSLKQILDTIEDLRRTVDNKREVAPHDEHAEYDSKHTTRVNNQASANILQAENLMATPSGTPKLHDVTTEEASEPSFSNLDDDYFHEVVEKHEFGNGTQEDRDGLEHNAIQEIVDDLIEF